MSVDLRSSDAPLRSRKRVWLPPAFVEAMLAGHSALGLAFAALIYVVCLTGSLTVFLFEFHRWEQPNAPTIEGPLTAKALEEATWGALGQARIDGAADDVFMSAPSPLNPRFVVSYHSKSNENEGEWIATADGHLKMRVIAPWSDFLASLHMNLHLPRTWGLFIVGLTGVALLSSLVSGLLAHPRIFKDAFALRRGGSKRLEQADLHNRLSVWGLPFHFVGMRSPGYVAFFNTYQFDDSGKLLGNGGYDDGGIGKRILGVIQPLHFGWFGGFGIKLIYGLLGLALTVVTQSGVAIWLARRRDKGRPVPFWERIWTATVWGQPLALAVSALFALRFGEGAIVTSYLATVVTTLVASAYLSNASAVRMALQALCAVALALVAITHAAMWKAIATDPAWLWVDATLLGTAIGLGVMATLQWRSRPRLEVQRT